MMRFPLLTLTLAAAIALVFQLERTGSGLALCHAYGLTPARYDGGLTPLLTSLFLHDPSGYSHVGGNLAFLLVFGLVVEGSLGTLAFGALFFAAGAAGGLLHVLVDPSATAPLVGASGGIFGILAVAGAVRPRLLGFVLGFGGYEVWRALEGVGVEVSVGAHLGGLAAGALFAAGLRTVGLLDVEEAV